ncbi:hypothetical protein DAEQUDRAFT_677134 [Daedalea quercina L-15889]|uniref:GST N-terminal domain-containing protein n=1 Tax=Daedalea quercina L-15889 TaxID=1314783 RepID=A0A165M5U2_9APHY|nr:hypothetical protein DAEQUDRAFT_677134 [Daedalea quercina L-15889]
MIIFYDIPSNLPVKAWSPSTWKTRYLLNLKGLPYRTEWVEYPDIAGLLKSFALPPTEPDDPLLPYTLPAIYDPKTKRAVAESAVIAAYLDDEYPETPAVIPKETRAFHAAFQYAFRATVQSAIAPLFLPRQLPCLTPASQPYFRCTREQMFGAKMEDICPPSKWAMQWAEIERAFGVVAGWLDGASDGRVTFLGGATSALSHADLSIAGWLLWMQFVVGKESEEWKAVERWHGGRWRNLLDVLEPYFDHSR